MANFNYDPEITTYYRGNYLDSAVTEFINVLKDEIDSRRPVYYSGCTQTYSSCHAYVLDGYDEDDLFHLNYGWGGSSNAYYAIDNFVAGPLHFDFGSETVIRIRPNRALESPYCQGHQRNTASFGYVADGSPTTKPYQANPDCSWMVAAPGAYEYTFQFDRLDLNEGDYVTIYNGPTEESGVLVSLTGSQLPNQSYTVSADSVLIKFVGNTGNTDHYGFLIAYTSSLTTRTCSQTTNLSQVWNATISDGSVEGGRYLPSTSCTWNVTNNFIEGYAFAFSKFNLGYGDFVDIYNNNTTPATLYQRFDINNQPNGVYEIPFKRMRVNFVSDNWDESEGFAMDFYAIAAIEDYNGLEDLTVYPNPAVDFVTLSFSLEQPETVTVRLMDVSGKVLRNSVIEANAGNNQGHVDVKGVAKGLYLLEISTPNGKSVRKVTVQ